MIDWAKQNIQGLSVIGIAVAILAVLSTMQSCSVYDLVKMHVPTQVQQVTGTAPVIPISEYPDVRSAYLERSAKGVEKLDGNYTDAAFWADLAAWGVNLGVDVGSAQASTLPGGAILTTAIAGIGGLMIRKPRDGQTINGLRKKLADQAKSELVNLAKEKMDSFNAGLKKGSVGQTST